MLSFPRFPATAKVLLRGALAPLWQRAATEASRQGGQPWASTQTGEVVGTEPLTGRTLAFGRVG